MFYKYAVTFHFRNGKIKEILATQCSTHKDPKGFTHVLTLNNEIVAELPEGIGNSFSPEEVMYYGAAPRAALFQYFPSEPEWDHTKINFNLIDKIVVNSYGREAGKQTKRANITPGDSC